MHTRRKMEQSCRCFLLPPNYLDQKRLALELLSDAARYNDADKLEWGKQVAEKNNAKAEEIKALIRQVY